jgi:protein tyrosine phosphatase
MSSLLAGYLKIQKKKEIKKEQVQEELDMPPPGGAEQVAYYRKICSKIRENFFLGSDYIARSKEILQENGITHIVNAAKVACDNYFPKDFKYCTLNLYDSPSQSIIGLFFSVIKFIEDATKNGGKVYVHCYAGVSRSSSIVIAYLMWKEKTNCRALLENVKTKRAVSSPNAGK